MDGINGRVIDMTVELTNVEGREFKVDVAHNEEYTTTFTYYPEKHQIEIDRTYSGVNADVVCVREDRNCGKTSCAETTFYHGQIFCRIIY